MAQYRSRLNITVKEHSVWDKLKSVNWTEYGLDQSVIEKTGTTSIVNDEWGIRERDLKKLVTEIAAAAPGKCLIIADTHNENVDPYNYMVYYLTNEKSTYWNSIQTKYVGWYAEDSRDIIEYAVKQAYSAEELYDEFKEEYDLARGVSDPSDMDQVLGWLLDSSAFIEEMYETLDPDRNDGRGAMARETEIADIRDWCSYGGICLYGNEEKYLSEYTLFDGYAETRRKMLAGKLSGEEMIRHLQIVFD